MRKILFLALLLFAVSAHAQFHFGFKGGASITILDDIDSHKSGWYIGPTADFTLPLLGLGIDASALYHQVNYTTWGGDNTKSFEIPVRLKYSFGLGRTLGGFIAAGPQFTFLLGDNYRNDFATSLNTAIGVKLLKHLQVEASYLFPIGRTMKDIGYAIVHPDLPAPDTSYNIKRKGWQLSLAYFF